MNYNTYTNDIELMAKARTKAEEFVAKEKPFHLGYIPTEQPHPYTVNFSQEITGNTQDGLSRLLEVDMDIPSVARKIFHSKEFSSLVEAMRISVTKKKKICFSGCGSTGRLAILLEKMWRQFWEDRSGVAPGTASRNEDPSNRDLQNANRACSIITGGERALIRAVENFEDYSEFGARQVRDLKLDEGDLLIAITEGGETSSVLGTATEGLKRGCRVFLAFNNPVNLLIEKIERSRKIIENPEVTVLDLYTGSMALTGSTRMQATTMELLVIGSAMEAALSQVVIKDDSTTSTTDAANLFAILIKELRSTKTLDILAQLAEKERDIYSENGRVTYWADEFLMDIFSDTTERSPTFMIPSLRPYDEEHTPVSWVSAKDPGRESSDAWRAMLRHAPRGLDWTSADYREIDAPDDIIEKSPILDNGEINRYHIGREDDPSRTETGVYWFLQIKTSSEDSPWVPGADVLLIGEDLPAPNGVKVYKLPINMPVSPVNLWRHLAVKLIFNTMSTGTMGLMGRIRGNWMVQVDPTNKKLLDRGSRIIAKIADIDYLKACYELILSLLAREELLKTGGETTVSPVIAALERLGKWR